MPWGQLQAMTRVTDHGSVALAFVVTFEQTHIWPERQHSLRARRAPGEQGTREGKSQSVQEVLTCFEVHADPYEIAHLLRTRSAGACSTAPVLRAGEAARRVALGMKES